MQSKLINDHFAEKRRKRGRVSIEQMNRNRNEDECLCTIDHSNFRSSQISFLLQLRGRRRTVCVNGIHLIDILGVDSLVDAAPARGRSDELSTAARPRPERKNRISAR